MTCAYFADLHNDIGRTSKQHGHEKEKQKKKCLDARVFADMKSPSWCIDNINFLRVGEWGYIIRYIKSQGGWIK